MKIQNLALVQEVELLILTFFSQHEKKRKSSTSFTEMKNLRHLTFY